MVAHDVLDDARYAHAPPSEDADDTVKTILHLLFFAIAYAVLFVSIVVTVCTIDRLSGAK